MVCGLNGSLGHFDTALGGTACMGFPSPLQSHCPGFDGENVSVVHVGEGIR